MANEITSDAEPVEGAAPADAEAAPNVASDSPRATPRPPATRGAVTRAALIASLVALAVVFGVLDVTHALFPQRTPNSTRPLVINARIIGGPTATVGAQSPLRATPEQVTMACNSASIVTLTSTASQPVSWSVDTIGQGLLIGANQPQAGILGPGQSAHIAVTSLGAAANTSLTLADDQSNLITVQFTVHCP